MSRLLETIKVSGNRLQNLPYHNQRLNYTRKEIYHYQDSISLEMSIEIPLSLDPNIGYKCRVLYQKAIEEVEFIPHHPHKIRSLKIVEDNAISYPFKYEDRTKLHQLFSQREKCEDILIIKDGFLTDTSIANVILFDGLKWYTPNTPLLRGTMRAQLLENQLIEEAEIRFSDLNRFKKLMVVNALNDFNESAAIPISSIIN